MRIAHSTLLLALIGMASAHGAEVYRTRAADGSVTYTDRPQNSSSEYVPVNTPPPNSPPPQRPQTGAADAANAPAPASAAVQIPGPTAAELREQRRANCATAREVFERLTISPRLYRTNAAGDREYLNEKEMAEARAKAQADVKEWCG